MAHDYIQDVVNKIYGEEGVLAFFDAQESIRNNRRVVLTAIKVNTRAYPILSGVTDESILGDKEVVLKALSNNPEEMQFVSNTLKADKTFILEALRERGFATGDRSAIFAHCSDDLKRDKEFIRDILMEFHVQNYGIIMENQMADIQEDDEFMRNVIFDKRTAGLLKYSSDRLRGDKELILRVNPQDARAIQYASEELQNDREFLLQLVCENENTARFIGENFREDDDFMLEAIKTNPAAFHAASETIRSNPEIIVEVIRQRPYMISYIGKELQNDREFLLSMVRENGNTLRYITNDQYKNDIEFKEAAARSQAKKTKLQQKETELSSLEAEAKTISEAEALIDQQKEGQNIGEE